MNEIYFFPFSSFLLTIILLFIPSKTGKSLTFLKPAQAKLEKKGKGKADYLRNQPEKIATKRSAENAELTLHDREQVTLKKPASKCKFFPQWQEEFTWVVFDKDDNKMTCKICCAFPHLAGKTEFVSGCCTFKETLQKHNIGHLCIRDASLAKQKLMENSPIAQGLRRGEGIRRAEQERTWNQREHYLSNSERRTALH